MWNSILDVFQLVCTDEPLDLRIILSASNIIEACLVIIIITSVAERVTVRHIQSSGVGSIN